MDAPYAKQVAIIFGQSVCLPRPLFVRPLVGMPRMQPQRVPTILNTNYGMLHVMDNGEYHARYPLLPDHDQSMGDRWIRCTPDMDLVYEDYSEVDSNIVTFLTDGKAITSYQRSCMTMKLHSSTPMPATGIWRCVSGMRRQSLTENMDPRNSSLIWISSQNCHKTSMMIHTTMKMTATH